MRPLSYKSLIVFISPIIAFSQKYQTAMTECMTNVDNLKDIFENAMAVVGLSKEDVAKAALVQKTLSASGVTPAVLAQAVLFQRALSASGLSPEEIVGKTWISDNLQIFEDFIAKKNRQKMDKKL